MLAARENAAYLPGIALPMQLSLSDQTDLAQLAGQHDLLVIATPTSGLRASLQVLSNQTAPVVWLC